MSALTKAKANIYRIQAKIEEEKRLMEENPERSFWELTLLKEELENAKIDLREIKSHYQDEILSRNFPHLLSSVEDMEGCVLSSYRSQYEF